MSSSFRAIFGELSQDDFKNYYFNREALCLRSVAHEVGGLFTLEDFFRALPDCENVRAVFGELKQARIAPNDASSIFTAGATICATGLEQAHPPLRTLVTNLKSELGFTGVISVRAYYSPPGLGFAAHYDPRVVTNVQISGSKKWWFGDKPAEEMPLNNSPIPLPTEYLERSGAINSVILGEADLLCLPSGVVHWAEAGDCPSLAINIAFDYIGTGIPDAISSAVRQRLLAEPQFRVAPFLPLCGLDRALVAQASSCAGEFLKKIEGQADNLYTEALHGKTS